jgi:hypothetical protein
VYKRQPQQLYGALHNATAQVERAIALIKRTMVEHVCFNISRNSSVLTRQHKKG